MLTNLFFTLTKDNWGLPYHYIIAHFTTEVPIRSGADATLTVLAVLTVGIIYEIYQWIKAAKHNKAKATKDMIQDLIANVVGVSVGAILGQV